MNQLSQPGDLPLTKRQLSFILVLLEERAVGGPTDALTALWEDNDLPKPKPTTITALTRSQASTFIVWLKDAPWELAPWEQ